MSESDFSPDATETSVDVPLEGSTDVHVKTPVGEASIDTEILIRPNEVHSRVVL